jgi:hypothetical protein
METKYFNNHIELVKFGINKWAMRDYVYPSFQANHKYWWFCGRLDKSIDDSKRWTFTMKEEDMILMTYRQVLELAKKYDKFLSESEWF